MKVRLEVLASTSIKRRKPWNSVVWLGKEQESLFLLDDKRVSVLYIPSGKTKRNIPKLSSLLSSTVHLCPSPGGAYLIGVQSTGDVFVWHKDTDVLKSICGLATLLQEREITLGEGCTVFPSPDCSHLLLIVENRHIFLWQKAGGELDHKSNVIPGLWSKIKLPDSIWIPPYGSKALAAHAVFTQRENLGNACQLSIVFNNRSNLSVCSLFLMFDQSTDKGLSSGTKSPATAEWTSLEYPLQKIHDGCEAIDMKGAYLCRYTHDGQVLAVAVNQKSPVQTNVLFVSPLTETVLVSNLRGCGIKEPQVKRGRQYWISDMAWTSDNLFLSVILRNGSAGLMSRLGEPLALYSKGCSVEIGPAYFLPFTPLISIQSDRSISEGRDKSFSVNSEIDPLHQRFSASTHPTLPIVLYSDGYLVIIAQLPSELTPMLFMRDLVLESSAHLKQIADTQRLDLTVANAYNLPAGDLESVKGYSHGAKKHATSPRGNNNYVFEEPSVSLNDTIDSDISFALGDDKSSVSRMGAIQNMSSGKIIFGEPDVLLLTDRTALSDANSTMKALDMAKLNLFNVWKLAVSTSELWSANFDTIVKHAVLNIIKLFSLVLDCPHIREMLQIDNAPKSAAVQTPSLFKVITMYRQLLDLVQFDCQQRHLLASVIRLSHKSLYLILESVGLNQTDPRIKTLTGCFTLLKFTEKSLLNTYITLPKAIQAKGLMRKVTLGEGENQIQIGAGEALHTDSQLAQRLTDSWKLLYKKVAEFVSSSEVKASDLHQGQALLSAIQQCLVELDMDVPKLAITNVSKGEKFSLDGKHTMAMKVWNQQLAQFHENGNVKNAGKLFHSLLYTYIVRNDLISAVSFVDNLILKANPHALDDLDPNTQAHHSDLQPSLMTFVTSTLKSQALHEPDMVPCIRDRSVRQVVQTMSRFMAAYFSNQAIFIFPPHNPTPLPAVHFETSIANSHIIPKYHEDLAATVRHQKLGSIWTVERTLEYLLLSGLVCEATWFADRMGDWKAAYQLSVSHILHKKLAQPLYIGLKKPLSLPEWLTPDAIMKRKLDCLVKDDVELTENSSDLSQLTKVLQEISLAGVMGFVEVGSWLLESLVDKLKAIVKQFSPLVTKDFYLPAPPFYLPQPHNTDKNRHSLEVGEEMKLRQRASSIIQLALCVMNASNLSIPVATWYVQALNSIQKKATQFKATTEPCCLDLPDVLYQYLETESEFPEPCDDLSVQAVQSNFRDLCALTWLLHARDKLSLSLRSREKFLNLGLDVESSERWLKECFVTLQWAVHLIPFSHFLSDEANIYKVVLSLLLELPHTEDTADILAEHMYDSENLHPEVQERLERTLSAWQGIVLVPEADGRSVGDSLDLEDDGRKSVTFLGASPRGKSLSVYFHKQCMLMDRVIKKKIKCFGFYEEFVFGDNFCTERSKSLYIGSRPFETKKSFFEFLDQFFSISFNKVYSAMAEKDRTACLPFLQGFAKEIVDREMTFFVERVNRGNFAKQGLSILSSPVGAAARAEHQERVGTIVTHSRERNVPGRTSGRVMAREEEAQRSNPPSRHVGLFRGKSTVEIPPERRHATVKRFESDPGPEIGQDPNTNHPNLTGIASRFAHSEESLYRSHGGTEQEKPSWSLVVNFGKKYTSLQQMVEWLEVWGNKFHTFDLDGRKGLLDIAPKIKIQIPAQLIILSLWLLEHKYRQNRWGENRKSQRQAMGRRGRRLSRSPARSQSTSPINRSLTNGSGLRTPPRNPATAQQLRRTVTPPLHQPPASRDTSVQGSPADEVDGLQDNPLRLSLQASSLEQNQIIDAYTQVLDGPEDSSSIGVSSLASDELDGDLRTTLNAIRNTNTLTKDNSSLNKVVFPKDESPDRANVAIPQPKGASTPAKDSKQNLGARTPSLSPPPPSHQSQTSQSVSQGRGRPGQDSRTGNQVGGDVASQLQGIIRDELRRIMEVQHKSVLAMMGALDGISPSDIANQTSHQAPPQKNVRRSSSKENKPQVSPPPPQQKWSDDDVFEPEDKAIAETLPKQRSPRRKMRGRNENMRHTLTELQNLQIETRPVTGPMTKPQGGDIGRQLLSVPPRYYQDKVKGMPSHSFSGFSRRQNVGEDDFVLPFLPTQAWTRETEGNQSNAQHPSPRLPLLRMNENTQSDLPFSNLNKFLSRVPPPPSFIPQAPPPQPFYSPPRAPHPSQATPPPIHFLLQAPPPNEQTPFPFMPPTVAENAPSGFPLLRFQSRFPDDMPVGQKDRVNQTRDRLLEGFHAQLLQDKENVMKQDLGQQRLQMESPDMQEVIQESMQSAHSVRQQVEPSRETEGDLEDTQEGIVSVASASAREASVADAATSDTQINDGFAMPRGVFESYLKLGEQLVGPEVNATNAAFQMKMAQAMQKEMERRIRTKVDFSTMTQEHVDSAMLTDPAMEVVRTAEAATSITKDAGSDPIQEAIDEYNLKRHKNIIPPDIYMGLRFADQDAPSKESTEKGRSFLNVVDIRGSAVLKDIPERSEEARPMDGQELMDSALLTSQQAAQQMGALEETLRRKLDPTPSVPQTRAGYDSLTVRLFDDLKPGERDSLSVAVLPRSSQTQPKSAMIRRLRDMTDQIRVIDEMSQNIERDFKSSHLLLSTIQDVNESIQISRSRSPSPSRMRRKPHKELRYSLDEESDEEMSERFSPSQTPVPKMSARSPQASARSAKSRSTLGSQSVRSLTLSGSEMTNLISEVLAQEGVDMQSAGFSQEMAELLEKDAKEYLKTTEKPGKMVSPRDKLLHVKKTEEMREKRSAEERENLKHWMTEKFKQRQEKYMQRRRDLIEREPRPFKSHTSPSKVNIKTLNDEMNEKRKTMASEFMSQRLAEAENLMGSIIVDKPELTSDGAAGDVSQRGSSLSPRRSPGRRLSPSRMATDTYSRSDILDNRRSRPRSRRTISAATWTPQKSPSHAEPAKPHDESPPIKGILKSSSSKDIQQLDSDLHLDRQLLASITEGSLSVDSSADLINYAKAVLEMDQRGDTPMTSVDSTTQQQQAPRQQAPVRVKTQPEPKVKSKSFADLVRLQRPEVTRKWKEMSAQRRQEEEDMARRAQQEEYNNTSAQMYQTEKQKIYDSKQIPGSSPRQTVTIPRRVKTYAERLQEMKSPRKQFTPSIVRPPGSARTMSSHTIQTTTSSRKHAPPHRPKTYVQQLQQISSRASTQSRSRRAPTKKVPVQTRTFMRSHGPLHKSQTYTEQLRSLNPHPHRERSRVATSGRVQEQAARHPARPHPYGDPYSEMDYEELASVLSDWELGNDVRNIIYGGSTPSNSVTFMQMDDMDMTTSGREQAFAAPSEGQSDYFDVIMNEETPFNRYTGEEDFVGDDYRTSVDINEIHKIADAASVRSDSVLSVIDWDKIDDLIRDV